MDYEERVISRLYVPCSSTVQPPVATRTQTLPFDQLTWQDFEKLCHRLVRTGSSVENCQQYGVPGEAQSGIDIFARIKGAATYAVYQCKNERSFGPAKIKRAVTDFVEGDWRDKSSVFVLCTQDSMQSTTHAQEIETQAQILAKYGVSFQQWGREELSLQLKAHPDIVDDFFGRPWVVAFCGTEAAQSLGERLDSGQRRHLRRELSSLYSRIFNLHDRGIPIVDVLPLHNRYVLSDVEWIETLEASSDPESPIPRSDVFPHSTSDRTDAKRSRTSSRTYSHRMPLASWVVRGKRNLLFGEPGAGKSTFLRFLALDLLQEVPLLADTAKRWGDHIPIWIPFALWTKVIGSSAIADRSIAAIITSFLQSWDAAHLVSLATEALNDGRALLLLDGLDEHSSNEAAKIALNHLTSFLGAHDIPVIATTRPHGFDHLEMNREGWRDATIAGLSKQQQDAVVRLWFEATTKRTTPSLQPQELVGHVERQSEHFFEELSRSRDLRHLAENPLLLCLLISFQTKNIRLPVKRFDAYAALTDHLIATHPEARRIAAGAVGDHELSQDDMKKMLGHLAATLHTCHFEGVISEADATATVQACAIDDEQGFGAPVHEAAKLAKALIARATHDLGILVRRSENEIGFFHRTIQEYLVSFHLSRLVLSEQRQVVEDRCNNPLWREVILGLLQITARPADVELLVETIRKTTRPIIDRQPSRQLLAEVAFGSFNCPPRLAKELARAAIHEIEDDTWLPHREVLLRHALDGLRAPSTNGMVKEKLPLWYQDRCGWSASRIFEAMGKWEPDDDVIETLFRGFNAEGYEAKRAAALSLARISDGSEIIRDRLTVIANTSEEPHTVAVATEALLQKWSDHKPLVNIVERCRASAVPELRVVGVRGRIEMGTHDGDDLTVILRLGDRGVPSYWLHEQVIELLLKGWPRDERVKRVCLDSAQRVYDGFRNSNPIVLEGDIALAVLLTGYSMDEEVASFCVDQIRTQRFPFIGLSGPEPLSLLARTFKDHPGIVKALDEWVERADHMSMEVSEAARVGGTATFKKRLLGLLSESFPHWPAKALLDIWGVTDPDVAAEFAAFMADPARASMIGHLLPQILTDRQECRRYLVGLLRNPKCERPDFVLEGLVELGAGDSDAAVVDAALASLAENQHIAYGDRLEQWLIVHCLDNPKVRKLAIKGLDGRNRDSVYIAVAQACGSDHELRASLLRLVTPLPTRLRHIIASHLTHADVDDELALDLLKSYDCETDGEVKVLLAIGYYSRLEPTKEHTEQATDDLARAIVCVGPDYEARRLAAFCGLVLLDRLDIMGSTDGHTAMGLRITEGVHVNVPAVRFVLKHWTKLQKHWGASFWQRLFGSQSRASVWNALAMFADEYPLPSREALEFYTQQETKTTEANGLRFVAKVRPGSPLLLDYCLTTLGLTEVQTFERQLSTPPGLHVAACATAAEIMGQHFADDEDLPRRLYNTRDPRRFDEVVLALSEGWPQRKELDQCFNEMKATRRLYWESNILRYCCCKGSTVDVYKECRRLIRAWSFRPEYRWYELYLRPIVVRLQHDKRLQNILIRHISSIATPSEKVSICRLLGKAVGLSSQLRQWAETELQKQSELDGKEGGFDFTSGEYLSIQHAIYGLLHASTNR